MNKLQIPALTLVERQAWLAGSAKTSHNNVGIILAVSNNEDINKLPSAWCAHVHARDPLPPAPAGSGCTSKTFVTLVTTIILWR